MNRCITAAFAALVLIGCTTAYQPSGATGGFSEVKLSETSYQVRFRGNGYTGPGQVQQFMLRRAAELALENGYRYFTTDVPQNLDRRDMWMQYSERGVTVRFSQQATAETADAVTVIESTNQAANGRLSDKAAAELARLKAQ
ncbi:MAG TPA: hypothetical protein VFN10_22585 [Thermoanaerobaculia bacterium]|nr:hypothetical protein [Thermoanaerobaculia bacterium]